jgi:hypothetical protein
MGPGPASLFSDAADPLLRDTLDAKSTKEGIAGARAHLPDTVTGAAPADSASGSRQARRSSFLLFRTVVSRHLASSIGSRQARKSSSAGAGRHPLVLLRRPTCSRRAAGPTSPSPTAGGAGTSAGPAGGKGACFASASPGTRRGAFGGWPSDEEDRHQRLRHAWLDPLLYQAVQSPNSQYQLYTSFEQAVSDLSKGLARLRALLQPPAGQIGG